MKKRFLLLAMLLITVGCDLPLRGSDWQQAADPEFVERENFTVLVFQNKLWVIGGHTRPTALLADVWSSSDGNSWIQVSEDAAFGARQSPLGLVFDNRMWIIGGFDAESEPLNDVWSSTDGTTWVCVTDSAEFSGRYAHSGAVSDDRMWVIGGRTDQGDMNDVWYSADGATWTAATLDAGFEKREGHSSIYFRNKLWVTGGSNVAEFSDMFSGIWSSPDGITWTKSNEDPFPARELFPLVEADGRIWVLGGFVTPHNRMDDVWHSSDGENWTQVYQMNGFGGRTCHAGAFFNNRLWVIAGQVSAAEVSNEVWYAK